MGAGASPRTALVLGGGGITGIGWELGVLAGLQSAGVDLTDAELVIGTSAGSVVAAQITSGRALSELCARQLEPPDSERLARITPRVLAGWLLSLLRTGGSSTGFRRRVGQSAVRAAQARRTPTLEERMAVIASRLPVHEWPDRDLRIATVDALTGALLVLDSTSGVDLVTAVAASCAVPGVYPPVPINGHPHIDGGMRSGANVDLAAGAERVVVLAPSARGVGPLASAHQQIADWPPGRIVLVTPDNDALRAIGRNVLDPAARARSAQAGRAQSSGALAAVSAVWRG